jgi:hypothetical protein
VTAVVLLGDIVERPTQRYLVTEVLNMWEVSMEAPTGCWWES